MMKKKRTKIMVGLAAAIAVALAALSLLNQSAGKKELLPQVPVTAAAKGDISQELSVTGTVESEKKKSFYSPVNAEISAMDFAAGDLVKKGSQLVTFDLESLEEENQKKELTALAGRYDYQNTINKSNEAASKKAQAQANVHTLESQVADWKGYVSALQDQIAQIAANDAAAAAQEQQAAADTLAAQEQRLLAQYQQEMKDYQETVLPEYQAALAEALEEKNLCLGAYNTADTEYQLAFQAWSSQQTAENQKLVEEKDRIRSQAQIALDEAKSAYEQLESNPPAQPEMPDVSSLGALDMGGGSTVVPTGTDTTALQNELEEASATLAELQSELASEEAAAKAEGGTLTPEERASLEVNNNLSELEGKTVEELIAEGRKGLQAEFTGVISESAVSQGATVTQGMQLFTLQSTEDVSVNVNVSKYDYDKLREGQKADITLGSSRYKGTVSKISRIAVANEKGAAMIPTRIHIDNPDDKLFLGVDAKVVIHTDQVKDVLLVPNAVVNIGKDGSFCYVVEDGVIVKKLVETGLASDSQTEILSGLKAGDAVVTDIGTCQEGDAVEAVSEDEDAKEA